MVTRRRLSIDKGAVLGDGATKRLNRAQNLGGKKKVGGNGDSGQAGTAAHRARRWRGQLGGQFAQLGACVTDGCGDGFAVLGVRRCAGEAGKLGLLGLGSGVC